jgi:hypothetical protein
MTGCAACIPAEPPATTEDIALDLVAWLVDESHYIVSVRTCPSCGQEFLRVFTERIDWVGGEDPQRITMLPISHQEALDLIALGENVDETQLSRMGLDRRFLEFDWPAGQPMTSRYTTGRLVERHD